MLPHLQRHNVMHLNPHLYPCLLFPHPTHARVYRPLPAPCSTLFKDADPDEFGLVDCDIKPTADATASRAYEDDFM